MVDPEWKREDLFCLDAAAEHKLKIWLATKLGVRYATCQPDLPFAQITNGVLPYNELVIISMLEDIKALHGNDALSTADKDAGARAKGVLASVINGCQVSWQAPTPGPKHFLPASLGFRGLGFPPALPGLQTMCLPVRRVVASSTSATSCMAAGSTWMSGTCLWSAGPGATIRPWAWARSTSCSRTCPPSCA